MDPDYQADRKPDTQYQDHLKEILMHGEYTKHPHQPVGRRVLLTLSPMVFNLANGFPLITEREMRFAKTLTPIAEMLAFVHGVRTGTKMKEWGCGWWKRWTTPEKCATFGLQPDDLGDGSYGPGFNPRVFEWIDIPEHPDGGRWEFKIFRQFEHLVREIKENPYLSTHKISPWLPQYCLQHSGLQRKVVVAPCHGDIQVTIIGDRMTLNMTQRSGDYPIGVPADIMMYAGLLIILAHVTGYKPHKLVHRVVDAHLYEDQIPNVEELIERKPFPFPTLHLTDEGRKIDNLYDFRHTDFELRDYKAHPEIPGIPVTE